MAYVIYRRQPIARNGHISHHVETPTTDEAMSPTLENLIVLTWLRIVHYELPNLVKQCYGTKLRSRSLTSLKPEISQALDLLLEEIRTTTDAKILHATTSTFRPFKRAPYDKCPQLVTKRPVRSCPLCKQAGRNNYHFLSKCTYLPADDCAFLTKACLTSSLYKDVETEDSNAKKCTKLYSTRAEPFLAN